jgi:hypothetical protein
MAQQVVSGRSHPDFIPDLIGANIGRVSDYLLEVFAGFSQSFQENVDLGS